MLPAGVGLGWRPAFAEVPAAFGRLAFAEVLADPLFGATRAPASLAAWRARGLPLVPHGLGLSLGSAEPPDPARLAALAALARKLEAPLVSEHVAFVRAGGLEAGHLLPVPRTRAALDVLVRNVRLAQAALPVPLALENGAPLADWPGAELDEADFLAALVARTGCWLVLDLANLHANAVNFGRDPIAALERLPLARVAYVHVAGGRMQGGRWEDTHAHPLAPGALVLLEALVSRVGPLPALLERDDDFPPLPETLAELGQIAAVLDAAPPRSLPAPTGPAPGADPDPDPAAVAALARDQEALIRALLADAPPPPGFDAAGLAAFASQLRRKRRRLVARALPVLAASLGEGFAAAFDAHARRHPSTPASPLRDGLIFARGLGGQPAAVARELALARVRLAPWPQAVKRLATRWLRWR